MGIYDKGIGGGIPLDLGKLKIVLIIVVVAVAVIAASYAVLTFAFNPISASFDPAGEWNPHTHASTLLRVRVYNPLPDTAQSAQISVAARDHTKIEIFPNQQVLSNLASGDVRTATFGVRRKNPEQDLLPGTYTFDIRLDLSGETYRANAVLKVLPPVQE